MKIPEDVAEVIHKLNQAGHEAFAVGGCVRDALMGNIPKDWDITTSARPNQIKACFEKTVDTGIKHGTVTVIYRQKSYEVTTYRIDGTYKDNRRPETVVFTEQLTDDLRRRDFTMNAIAFHEKTGLVDPFNGLDDIEQEVIRGVGDPALRFQEDGLRMLRAVRFCAQLGFQIEEQTKKALLENASLITNISVERIRDEIVKILCSANPGALDLLHESKLMKHISEQLAEYYDQFGHKVAHHIARCPKQPVMRLTFLFLYMKPDKIEELLRHFRFDNKTIQHVLLYKEWLPEQIYPEAYSIRKALSAIGPTHLHVVLMLKSLLTGEDYDPILAQLQDILNQGDCISLRQLALNGQDLKDEGILDGQEIGRILNDLLDIVLQEPAHNEKEILLNMIRSQLF